MNIHPLTHIHPDAVLGQGCTVSAFTTIEKNVVVGEGTWIGPNVTLMEGARIGKHCKIYPGAVISGPPQDLKYKGEVTEAHIGDRTVIRECVTISRGTSDRYKTEVGENCLIMAYVHIAHDCVLGDNCILSNAVQVAGHVEIADYVIVGGTTAVHQFSKIGEHAIISGGSLVRKDVPPYVTAAREPLSYCGVNTIGLKRRGFSQAIISDIQEVYRNIYLRGFNNSEALKTIEAEVAPSPERDAILQFIKNSERGIMKGG